MSTTFEPSPVPHYGHHSSVKSFSSSTYGDDPMSSTRPRSGGSAPLDMIMNSDSSQQAQSRPRIVTSLTSSLASHRLPALSASGPDSLPGASIRSPAPGGITLPPLGELRLPNGHPSYDGQSAVPSSASELSSGRASHFPPIGKPFSATTPPLSYRGQPSPPTSLRSPHRGIYDTASPPAHFASMQTMRVKPLSPQSEATTPASAFSGTSFQSPSSSLASSVDAMHVDSGRPILPPPVLTAPGMNTPGIVFRCKHSGCIAPPFQTQYLLNSHMNVHSSSRPHYCPVKKCPRGEGGKGFKRKNEMIRHGLVHQSPGYACPFCPDREHKYPRPDNLQRHVKVHHVDKDKDDPRLREVLNQRLDGGSRGRRRRANS